MIKESLCSIKWIDKKSYEWPGFWSDKMPQWYRRYFYKCRAWNILWCIYSDIDFIKFIINKKV